MKKEKQQGRVCSVGGQAVMEGVMMKAPAGIALAVRRGECLFAPPPDVPVRSTVGAGDAMVAGAVVALEAGEELEAMLRAGVAAAGAAVATEGTQAAPLEAYQHIYKTISIQKVM